MNNNIIETTKDIWSRYNRRQKKITVTGKKLAIFRSWDLEIIQGTFNFNQFKTKLILLLYINVKILLFGKLLLWKLQLKKMKTKEIQKWWT